MAQKIGIGVIAGLASLVLLLTAAAGSAIALVSTIFHPLPIFLAGLSLGTTPAVVGTGTVFLFVAIAGGLLPGSIYLASFGLPMIIIIHHALLNRVIRTNGNEAVVEWYPAEKLLLWMVGTACALFSLLFIGSLGLEGGLAGQATRQFAEMVESNEAIMELFSSSNPDMGVEAYIEIYGPIWPIMACLSVIPIMAANAGLAQRWLVRLGKAIRPSPKLLNMTLPEPLLLIFVLTALLSLVSGQIGYLGGGLSTLLMIPYFLLGLTVVHAISSAWPGRRFGLTVFYSALFFLIALIAPMVALIGMAEPWLKLRERFAPGGPDQPKPQGD